MIIIPLLLLVLGFFLLVRSSDWLIDGASVVAKRFHVPDLTIGLTIIAFGTSAPELVVSLIAAFTGSGDLSVANIIGSNIANILLILGVAAIIYPLTVKRSTTWKEIPFSLLAIVILGVMALGSLHTGIATFQRSDGIILLSFFALFMAYMFKMVRDGSRPADLKDVEVKRMKMKKAVLLTVAGIIGFALGGRAVVSGAVMLARNFGLSERLIGLTIVAIGTSLPELVTSAVAAFKHRADIAVGNIIGSNIANILLILGVAAVIYPLTVKRSTTWKEIPFSLLAIIILGVMALDSLRTGSATFQRSDGIILLSFFVLFMVYVFDMVRSGSRPADLKDIEVKHMKVKKAVFLMVAGIIGLALGGRAVVSGAVVLARTFGFSERLIGLTIVAIGTSLPELVTSAVAAFKHRADIAVGNIIGSNIFNIFWILGLTATIRPISVPVDILGDILVAIGATLLLMLFLFVGPRRRLDRVKGSLLLASYFGYLVYLVVVR